MFRNREKGKKEVKEPKKQKEKVRFKWHAPHDNIIEKKNWFKLTKIYLGVWIFLFYDPC